MKHRLLCHAFWGIKWNISMAIISSPCCFDSFSNQRNSLFFISVKTSSKIVNDFFDVQLVWFVFPTLQIYRSSCQESLMEFIRIFCGVITVNFGKKSPVMNCANETAFWRRQIKPRVDIISRKHLSRQWRFRFSSSPCWPVLFCLDMLYLPCMSWWTLKEASVIGGLQPFFFSLSSSLLWLFA